MRYAPRKAAELLESWINGNRNHVRLELKRSRSKLATFAQMIALCDEHGDLATRNDLIAAFSREL